MVKILVGLPGSGKTTYARYLEKYEGYVRLSQDELCYLPNVYRVFPYICDKIKECVQEGKDVVVDGTFVSISIRKKLLDFCDSINGKTTVVVFDEKVEDCIKHNNEKKEIHKAHEIVIRQLDREFQMPTERECKNIETIDDSWFKKHKKEVGEINSMDYEKILKDQINEIRFVKGVSKNESKSDIG